MPSAAFQHFHPDGTVDFAVGQEPPGHDHIGALPCFIRDSIFDRRWFHIRPQSGYSRAIAREISISFRRILQTSGDERVIIVFESFMDTSAYAKR
jgi:hypothetical protein